MATTQAVYGAICAVAADLAREGIAKASKNAQQGYQFRGIDSVYNALAPFLAKHNLCILPRVMHHQVVERQAKSGGAIFYTTLTVEFDFVSAVDGSKHTVCTIGEAMDSADKSSNKAMSAAFKYAAFQAFCIPTEGDNDADAQTHEVEHHAESRPYREVVRKPSQATSGSDPESLPIPFGKDKGKRLGTCSTEHLISIASWCMEKGKFSDIEQAARTIIAKRDDEGSQDYDV